MLCLVLVFIFVFDFDFVFVFRFVLITRFVSVFAFLISVGEETSCQDHPTPGLVELALHLEARAAPLPN